MTFENNTPQLFTLAARKEGGALAMRRLLVMFTVALLLTTQLVISAPRLMGHAQIADAQTLYLVGLSTQVTVTIRNPGANSITVALIPLNTSGQVTSPNSQHVDLSAMSTKELEAGDLPAGTFTLRMEADAPFDAYAYERRVDSERADFIPSLSTPALALRFPPLVKGDMETKSILLFNPTNQVGSAELIAMNNSGLEVARGYMGPVQPGQTLELRPSLLLSTVSDDDVSLVVMSSVMLVGRQRVLLPRGDKMTIPGFSTDAEGVRAQVEGAKASGNIATESLVNSAASTSLDDYPYQTSPFCPASASSCPSNTIDPYSFYFRECTSFVAWRMNRDARTTDPLHPSFTNTMRGGHWGNGGNWSANAVKLNYRVDKVPEVGAVAQWNSNECSGCSVGHVAYVESINPNGTLNLSEYNYSVGHGYDYRQNVSVSNVGRFIHVSTPVNNGPRTVVSASVRVLTTGPFTVNQSIQITFSVTNRGGQAVTFQKLLAGGRRDGDPNCTIGGCPDFPALTNVTLNPNQSITYTQTQTFGIADHYNFFAAYLTTAGWVTNVDVDAGVNNSVGITINQKTAAPTLTGYTWNATPRPNQPFSGTITGSGFVSGGTQVWFCLNGSSTCYQQPAAGVSVNSSTSLNVSNVNLGSGSWQIFVQTSAGQSARSPAFIVQAAVVPPTISGYSWNTTPRGNQPFSGTITGTGLVTSGTQVWFCLAGTSTCYQQPTAGVSVNSSTSMSVSNVNLGSGAWDIYVQTSAGQSARSGAFPVLAAAPTISGYSWNPTPTGSQPFNGTISGSAFVAGGTQVWFCVNGSSTCYQQPPAGITVSSTSVLNVSNVRLGTGSWQFYLQTSAGQSTRSATFTIR